MKDNVKASYLDSGIDIGEIHGHMDIVLTDVNTGEVEVIHEDNLITNALRKYFINCGFMNYPSLDKSQIVELLMGGLMCFNDNISEDASILHAPAGLEMTANAAQGYTNNTNTEQGTMVANDETHTYNGWQSDGSYLHTYEWATGQGNGTIACVCLAARDYAWIGEGNPSGTKHSTKASLTSLQGSITTYSGIVGTVFNVNLSDSSCYAFAIETTTVEEETVKVGKLRKYRLPISKLDVRGTTTSPVLLSETTVTLDADIKDATLFTQPLGNNLLLWNIQYDMAVWDDGWDQYLWTLTPAGVLTKVQVTNTTGEELHGLQAAHFDGKYCFFIDAYNRSTNSITIDSTNVYIWNRNTDAMRKIENPYGTSRQEAFVSQWSNYIGYVGWYMHRGTGDGKILTSGSYPFVVDAETGKCYPNNANTDSAGNLYPTASPLVRTNGQNLYRDQTYIASINNLANPVVKTSEKSMKITYRITFEEESPDPQPTPTHYDVEPYYEDATRSAVEAINGLGSEWDSFVVVTDTHDDWNENHSQDIIREIVQRTSAKAFWLGDCSAGLWGDGSQFEVYADKLISCRGSVYFALGNHDRIGWSDFDLSQVQRCYNVFLSNKDVEGVPTSYYYYFDNAVKKIRYMVINTSESETNHVTMSATQIAWIGRNVQLPDSTWSLVVIGHCDIDPDTSVVTGGSANAQDICDAIETCNGHVVGYFCGHQHIDRITTIDSDFKQVTLLCDCIDDREYYPEIYDYPTRTPGTASEQAVTVVSFNTSTGVVQFTRIGAYSPNTLPSYNYKS